MGSLIQFYGSMCFLSTSLIGLKKVLPGWGVGGLGGLGRFGSRFLWSVTNLSGMHPIGVGVLTHV